MEKLICTCTRVKKHVHVYGVRTERICLCFVMVYGTDSIGLKALRTRFS